MELFFVLSGFIMMHIHYPEMGKPQVLASYFWKRFTRIYWTYWVVLALLAPVYFLAPGFGKGHERQLDSMLFSIFLVPHPNLENVLSVGVAWTLVFEVFFYLLFSVTLLHRRIGIRHGAPGSVGSAVLVSARVHVLSLDLFLQLHEPLLLDRCRGGAPDPALDCSVKLIRIPAFLTFLGNASYSIYLLHFAVLSLEAKVVKSLSLDHHPPGKVLFVLIVAGAVGASCLFHQLVEQRLLTWSKQSFRSQPGTSADLLPAGPALPRSVVSGPASNGLAA